jgi:[acyl-carrier-protein] S-malonyltransferase
VSGGAVWLAPGQGMERVGMGLAVAAGCAEAARLIDVASAAAGADLRRWLQAPGRDAERTELAQPAWVAVALGAAAALREAGFAPDIVAGHSLGELAAWSIAGGCAPEEAVRLAAARGRAMAAAARAAPGGMRAVAWEALDRAPPGLTLAVENPDVAVLSGPTDALAQCPLGVRVPTGGPWHSPAMCAAEPAVRDALAAVPARPLHTALISHGPGAPVDDDGARAALAALSARVRWREVLARVVAAAPRVVVVLGPAKVLRHHLRLVTDARVVGLERMEDLAAVG